MKKDRKSVKDHKNRNVVMGLFEEFARTDASFKPPYNLVDTKELYLALRDPTEYKIAMELVGDWPHWQEVRNHPTLKPIIDGWQAELEVMLRSEAVEAMVAYSKQPGGITAAKWLHDKGYNQLEKAAKGRPANKPSDVEDKNVEAKLGHVLHIVRK